MRRVATALAAAGGLALALATPVWAAATSYPDDYFFAKGDQWALTGATPSIQAPAAWCTSTGAHELVAMVDTGADFGHPDLQGKLQRGVAYTGGTATTESQTSSTSLDDVEGHGTLTTGLVVAATDNNTGIAAVAPDAQALVMQVYGPDDTIWDSDVALAIEYAADHGANVINVSLGPDQVSAGNHNVPNLTIPFAANYAAQKGAAVVLAAGNKSQSQPVYPNLSGIALVVGALTASGTMASYSNHGSDVSIYAPGGDAPDANSLTLQNSVVSTFKSNEYVIADGTSVSAPLVSGALALIMAHNGNNAKAAMSAVTGSAVQRNGLPELDAAAALGVPDSQRCGTPTTSSSGPPPPLTSGGGQITPPPSHPATTSTNNTTQRTTSITRQTQTTTTSASTSTVVTTSTDSGSAQAAGNNGGGGGAQPGKLPPASTPRPGQGGVPAPLVIGGLAVLLGAGAPLGVRLVRLRRGRSLMR